MPKKRLTTVTSGKGDTVRWEGMEHVAKADFTFIFMFGFKILQPKASHVLSVSSTFLNK